MHWFRSRSSLGAGLGSWLALLVRATQLVVSFGHVHLDRGVPLPGHASVLLGAPASGGTDAGALPASGDAPAIADDYCAICALIHLASTTVAAEPPSLPLPAVFRGTF